MKLPHDTLLRFLEGDLPSAEMKRIADLRLHDVLLDRRLARMEAIRTELRELRREGFAPGFSNRVMRRLQPDSPGWSNTASMYEALRWAFLRTSIAGLSAIILLTAFNLFYFNDLYLSSTFVETIFGLPDPTLDDALTAGLM